MADRSRPIPPEDWATIVANVPLVSVDLVIEYDGGIVLGKRENEPAKGEWFVPGGTVLKNESRVDAVYRVASEELGGAITVDDELGVFEHFYDTSEVPGVQSKQYVATAYQCHFERDVPAIVTGDQHDAIDVFEQPIEDVHPYVRRYVELLE